MAKLKVYLRVAKTHGSAGHRVVATTRPSHLPLSDTYGSVLPTIAFAIVLDIDAAAFRQAERVMAELAIEPERVMVAAELDE
jgi:hypothetical protein